MKGKKMSVHVKCIFNLADNIIILFAQNDCTDMHSAL